VGQPDKIDGEEKNLVPRSRTILLMPSITPPNSVTEYIEDGAHIAAILLIWGVLAAVATYGLSDFGGHGGILDTLGPQLGGLLALTGVLNAILYVLYRTLDYWHQYE
jgi:hypothetical protein